MTRVALLKALSLFLLLDCAAGKKKQKEAPAPAPVPEVAGKQVLDALGVGPNDPRRWACTPERKAHGKAMINNTAPLVDTQGRPIHAHGTCVS